MALTDTLKRAPRWAWVTAAGIGLGSGALYLWRGRGKPPTTATATDATAAYGGPLPTSTGNPIATIVPPVMVQGNGADPNAGVGQLQDLYIGAVQGVVQAYGDVWGPWQGIVAGITQGASATIQDLAIAGGSPQSYPVTSPGPAPAPETVYIQPPAPQEPVPIQAPPSAAAAPVPAAAAAPARRCSGAFPLGTFPNCFKDDSELRTRDNGKTGNARRVWCARVGIHRYQDGHGVVTGESKVRDGSC